MEEDDDDFYGGGGAKQEQLENEEEENDEKMEVSDEEEDDSDDDVEFTLEKPEGAKTEAPPTKQQKTQHNRTVSESKPAKSSTPIKAETSRAESTAPPTAVRGTLTHNGKEGKDFPEIRTSKIDVNGTPKWANGKPITEVDIDADLAENSKPWRLPGTDITDFFNYGFDEYTWTQYCLRQQTMGNTIESQKQEDAKMKLLLGGGGGPGGMPPMPPGMPGMEQFEEMMRNGFIPPDFSQMGGGMGGGMGGMNMGQQNQFQQGGQGGGYGSGQNSMSPHPQAGQGFQPPSGPSGDQNMDGYSPQQLAIMQQEQSGGHMQGGGGRGGRGRGRRGRW